MVREVVVRSDGETVDLAKEDAEQAELTANAKKVIGVDASGNLTDASLIKFDPDDSQPTYIGTNDSATAATSDTDWLIYKFTYSGSNITQIQKLKGAWDVRATLF